MDLQRENYEAADSYLARTLVGDDAVLDFALAAQRSAGLPDIEVSPVNGKLLNLLVRMSGSRRVLEIGTLGAYSTIWMARAVGEGGLVTTIEAEPVIAGIARSNIDRAGLGERVQILVGRGEHILPTLIGSEPFEFVFIDADKESNTLYLDFAARLGHSGTVVVLDNIGRNGDIVDEACEDSMVVGTRAALEMLGTDPRFDATAFQTLGLKGWDGTALALIV